MQRKGQMRTRGKAWREEGLTFRGEAGEAMKGAALGLKKSRLEGLTCPWETGLTLLTSVPFSPITYSIL